MTIVAKTKWLNQAEMRAWLAYVTTSVDLQRAIERDLEPFGLDGGDYQLLAMLSDAPDRRMKMCDLADTLRLSRSGLTRRMEGVLRKKIVARLETHELGLEIGAPFGGLVEQGAEPDLAGAALQEQVAGECQRPARFENIVDQQDRAAGDLLVNVARQAHGAGR